MSGNAPNRPSTATRRRRGFLWRFLRKEPQTELGSQVEPYPGLVSFQDRGADRLLFRGREAETEALLNLVQAEDLVLLFSRSGMGKTSLINAGLMEPLRQRGYFPVVVRLTHDPAGHPLVSVYECVEKEAARPERSVTLAGPRNRRTLWQYFHEARFLTSHATDDVDEGTPLRPILILDQFEELFTRIRDGYEDGERRLRDFVQQLADLIHHRMPADLRKEVNEHLGQLDRDDKGRKELVSLLYSGGGLDVKILVAMREDYLAELATLKSQVSGISRHTFRLEPLTKDQARQAIEVPCSAGSSLGLETFKYAPGVVAEMLEFLSRRKLRGRWVSGESVDPAQLQILCRHLNERRRDHGAGEITHSDLGGELGMKRILRSYYTRSVRKFPLVCLGWNARKLRPQRANLLLLNRPRLAVRRLCEQGLITPDGQRNSLALSSVAHQFGVDQGEADLLVERKLLRAEDRLGGRFYELSHDTLIEPVQTSRRRRRIREMLARAAILAAIPIAFVYRPELKTAWTRHKVFDTARPAAVRTALLMKLVEEGKAVDFGGLQLPGVQLGNQRLLDVQLPRANLARGVFANSALHQASFTRANLAGADFSSANADYGRFDGANLGNAVFLYASIANASFTEADLTGADFTGAILPGTRFTNAILRRANFSKAKARDAIFTGADLTEVQFEEADCTGAQINGATFKDADWWLGYWSSNQIEQLRRNWPVERFFGSPRYQEQIRSLTADLAKASTNEALSRSAALNNLAWYRATHGSQAELKQARKEVNESLGLEPEQLETLDTCGYILLRLGDYPAALANFEAAVRRSDSAGYSLYHLALAFDYLNDDEQAPRYYERASDLQYRPSYELVLTPPRLKPDGVKISRRDTIQQRLRSPLMKK